MQNFSRQQYFYEFSMNIPKTIFQFQKNKSKFDFTLLQTVNNTRKHLHTFSLLPPKLR